MRKKRVGFCFDYRETSGFWLRVGARALRVPIFFGSLIRRTGRCAPLPSLITSLLLFHLRKINYFQKQNASLQALTRAAIRCISFHWTTEALILTIYTPMIYTAPCVMVLMRADTFCEQVGGGLALEIESFLGPVKWHRADR